MKTLRSCTRPAVALIAMLGFAGAHAAPVAAVPATPQLLHSAASDCHAIGQQIAAENGGQLARAKPASQDGRPVCVIVVLVPAKEGSRPRRIEVVVPQG